MLFPKIALMTGATCMAALGQATPTSYGALKSQLNDLAVTSSAPKVIAVGGNCSAQNPCRTRLMNAVYSYTGAATATITAGSGSGLAKVYVSDAGVVTVEYPTSAGLTVQASGMNAVPVTVPAVPANAIPLGDVTISGGNWATVTDTRAFLTAMPLIAGNGIVLTQTAGRAQIDVDLGIVPSLAGANVFTGQTVASVATKTAPNRIGTSDPPNCDPSVRETFYNTSTNTLRVCTGTNSWTSANTVSVASTGLGYFLPSGPTSAGAQSASGTSATYFLQFILPFPMSVSSIGLNLAGGGTAGQAAAIAIYDASCNKIAGSDVRQVGLASSGAVFPGLSATITLGPGVYYFGFGTDSSTASFQTAISSTMAALLNQPSNPRVFSGNALTGSGATLSLPASCGSKTAGGWSVPSVALLP